MNSAKLMVTTVFTMGVLGMALFSGCTVTSGTNDVDSGTQNNGTSGGTSTGTSGGTGTGTDAGNDVNTGTPGLCPNNKQDFNFDNAVTTDPALTCQNCLETSCCTQLTECFDVADNGEKQGCKKHAECLQDAQNEQGEIDTDTRDVCNGAAVDGVQAKWEAIETCRKTSCNTQCPEFVTGSSQ